MTEYEEDRLKLLHEIVFNATIQEWELVEKYKELYVEIYGALHLPPSTEVNNE